MAKQGYIYVFQNGDSFYTVEGFNVHTNNLGFYTSKEAALKALDKELRYFWRYDSCAMVLRNNCMISCTCMDPMEYRQNTSFWIRKQPLNTRCENGWSFTKSLEINALCNLSSISGTITEEQYERRYQKYTQDMLRRYYRRNDKISWGNEPQPEFKQSS